MIITADNAVLLAVDLQTRLMDALHQGQQAIDQTLWLAQIARRLDIPVLLTEQYPQGLGTTVDALRQGIVPEDIIAKTSFSAAAEAALPARLETLGRRQVVLTGAEAHVCVLQTALGLLAQGFEIYLVAEGVASRRPEDRQLALERLRDAGVRIVSREMVAFEWLQDCRNPQFREIHRDFIR